MSQPTATASRATFPPTTFLPPFNPLPLFTSHPSPFLSPRTMPHSFNAFISFPLPFSKPSPPPPPRAKVTANIRPRTNWPLLSRRAQEALANIEATTDPHSFEPSIRRSIREDPTNPFLWHALAKFLSVDQTDTNAAILVLDEAVRAVPQGLRGGLFEAWGTLELRRGNMDRALTIYVDALPTDPFVALYTSLAVAQMKFHMLDDARETFRQGTLAFPNHAPLFRAWAHFETKHGSPSVAADCWRAAIAKDRSNARAWSTLAQLQQKRGVKINSLADLLYQAIASCPLDTHLRIALSRIEERRKGLHVAKSVLTPLENHADVTVLRALGRMEFQLGNREQGRNYFKRAVDAENAGKDRRKSRGKRRTKEPTVRSLHSWAFMESKHGHFDRARELLQRALSVNSNDSGIWRALGEIESRQKNYQKAREAFQRAVDLDPDDGRLYLAWSRTEALAGNTDRAETLIDRVSKFSARPRPRRASSLRDDDSLSNPFGSTDTSGSMSEREDTRSRSLTPEVLASALRERALLASRDGRFEDSVRLLTRASVVEPSSETSWRLLASHQLRLIGIESARAVYERGLLKVERRSQHKLLHWWGQDERSHGDVQRARDLFQKTTQITPDYMSAWMSWGLLEKSEGNMEEACSIFEQATDVAEKNIIRAPFIFQAWGRIEELDCGRVNKAADIFQRGVRLAPRSGPLWAAWGMLERRRANFEKARELFHMATTAEPKHGTGWQSWATLEAQRCNFKKAADLFKSGSEHDPANASLFASWALMEGRDLGNVALGRDLYERATNADPKYGLAWHAWGCLEMGAGNINRARDLLSKASQMAGEEVAGFHSLGILEAEHCNNVEAAIENWQRALEVSPDHSLSYQSWALLRGREGDMDEARRVFQEGIDKAESRDDDIAMLLQAWATLEEQRGSVEKAREMLRRSLGADSKRAETWHALAGIEKRRGLREESRQLLREAAEVCLGNSKWVLYAALGTLEGEDGNAEEMRDVYMRGIKACPASEGLWKSCILAEKRYGSEYRSEELQQHYEDLYSRRRGYESGS